MQDIGMMVGGLVLLFFGGEGLLRGSVSLAHRLGLSRLLVSAVIVGFGTSMPELTVSLGAALKGSSDIALGNVVGSNIANILLIVGIAALLRPIHISNRAVRRDTVMMVAASLVLAALGSAGMVTRVAGGLMLAALVAYIAVCYRQDRRRASHTPEHIEEEFENGKPLTVGLAALYSVLGLALLVGGAALLVEGAVALARGFGLSEAVIGLTIVAVGTSLPELATAVVASLRRHGDVVMGNILGSNIFNIFAILGLTALIQPMATTGRIAEIDVWIMLAVALALAPFLWWGLRLNRIAGVAMLGAYALYTAWLYGAGS